MVLSVDDKSSFGIVNEILRPSWSLPSPIEVIYGFHLHHSPFFDLLLLISERNWTCYRKLVTPHLGFTNGKPCSTSTQYWNRATPCWSFVLKTSHRRGVMTRKIWSTEKGRSTVTGNRSCSAKTPTLWMQHAARELAWKSSVHSNLYLMVRDEACTPAIGVPKLQQNWEPERGSRSCMPVIAEPKLRRRLGQRQWMVCSGKMRVHRGGKYSGQGGKRNFLILFVVLYVEIHK